jgi:hypothetical protein
MTASVGVVRYPTEAFAKGGNSNECKRSDDSLAHCSEIIIHAWAVFIHCQLSLFISDFNHKVCVTFW